MLHKLKQQAQRHQLTPSNRVPNHLASKYIHLYLRTARQEATSPHLRAAMGLLYWNRMRSYHRESRVSFRAGCFITGRARGTSQRFTVARTHVKQLSALGKLFGVRKSSW